MTKLIRNGIAGIFSDTDIKSGQPQRYGWYEEGKEKKTLPKEIIQFIERKKAPVKKETNEVKDESTVQVVKKTKTKKNDNPKQKDRPAAKRKPRRVEKN